MISKWGELLLLATLRLDDKVQVYFQPRRRLSVTVKLDGVDRGGDGPSAVASPLLLGLLVAEGLALCELEHVVCFLAPVAARSPLWK